jgi:hypothetical protein
MCSKWLLVKLHQKTLGSSCCQVVTHPGVHQAKCYLTFSVGQGAWRVAGRSPLIDSRFLQGWEGRSNRRLIYARQLTSSHTSSLKMEATSLTTIWCNIFIIIISGVGLSPLGTADISGQLYKPQMIDEGDCGAIGGMQIDRGNRSTRRKPASAPLCPPQIPHDQTRARTQAAAVGS